MVVIATEHKLDPTLRHFMPLHAAYRPADLCKSRQNRFIFSGLSRQKSPNPGQLAVSAAKTNKWRKSLRGTANRTSSLPWRRGSISRILFPRETPGATTILLVPPLPAGSCDLTRGPVQEGQPSPAMAHETAGKVLLFGLAPDGVCPHLGSRRDGASSYLAVSPLPPPTPGGEQTEAVCFLWHFPPITRGRR